MIFGLIKEALSDFREDNALPIAAALSFYTVFALPPLLILITMIAGMFWDAAGVEQALILEIQRAIGPDGAEQVRSMIQQGSAADRDGAAAAILSVAALLFGATGAFAQLQDALNTVWEVRRDPRKGGFMTTVMKRVLSFGMILVIVFLLLVSLVVSAVLTAAGGWVAAILPGTLGDAALWTANLALSLVVITLLFMAIYRVLPDAKVAWEDVFRGALVTAVLFVAGEHLLGLYFSESNPGSVFGAAGSLAIIFLWVYYSAVIFLLGAEITQVYADRVGSGVTPEKGAVRAVIDPRMLRSGRHSGEFRNPGRSTSARGSVGRFGPARTRWGARPIVPK
jgi:membrane protein